MATSLRIPVKEEETMIEGEVLAEISSCPKLKLFHLKQNPIPPPFGN